MKNGENETKTGTRLVGKLYQAGTGVTCGRVVVVLTRSTSQGRRNGWICEAER